MSSVVALPGVVASNFQPDAECIEFLELMLARARAGEIVGVVIVSIGPQGSFGTGWKGNATITETAAGIGLLHHRFYSDWHGMD